MSPKTDSTVGPRPFAGRAAPSASPVRPGTAEATQEGAENETFTKAEVTELLKKSEAKSYQQTQSLLDQLDHRQAVRLKATMDPVERTLARLAKAGVKVDEETADSVRSQARVDALSGQSGAEDDVDGDGRQAETNGRTRSAQPRDGEPTIGNLIVKMMQERGVFVLDKDPEAKMIDVREQDPQKLMAMADNAINAKIARLANVEVPVDEQTETEIVVGEQVGPGPNLKGKGSKGTRILAEGEPMDYLKAGYDESPEFPHEAQ